MQFEIFYAGTQARLSEQIEKEIADGWEMRGEAIIIEPEVPKSVYFPPTMIRERVACQRIENLMPLSPRLTLAAGSVSIHDCLRQSQAVRRVTPQDKLDSIFEN